MVNTPTNLNLEQFLDSVGLSHGLINQRIREHTAPAVAAREILAEASSGLDQLFIAGGDVRHLVLLRSQIMDALLASLWSSYQVEGDVSLLAVGGYGRAELHPQSDIDLLILTRDSLTSELGDAISQFITLLWDLRLDIGHSVRSIEECIDSAKDDLTIATNLLETRTIIGDEALRQAVLNRVYSDEIYTSENYFLAKREEQRIRHEKYRGSEYNLEPNLKASPGTLRDVQTLAWITKRHFGPDATDARNRYEFLTDDEFNMLLSGETFLWSMRYGLQMIAARNENRLLFDHQKKLSEILGYEDTEEKLGVEQMMQQYFRTVTGLAELTDVILQYFDDFYLNPEREVVIEALNKRFQVNNGYIEVTSEEVFERSPYALLELFLLQAQNPDIKGIKSTTIRLMREQKYLIDESFRNDLTNTSLFRELLVTPHRLDRTLNAMLKYNVLGRYLPEMGKITGLVQHDLFHIYTVDAHTIQLIKCLIGLQSGHIDTEMSLAAQLILTVPKLELLYVAGIYHDIAKGRGGDHSTLGAEDAKAFCQRHRFSDRDTQLVCWLVEHHLLMSMTSQRKDIADPDVIYEFARQIPSLSHLVYLYILTVCDISATNPSLWNSWRATLLQQLFIETRRALSRGIENQVDRNEWVQATRDEVAKQLIDEGYASDRVDDVLEQLDDDYFLHDSTYELVWQTSSILRHGDSDSPLISIKDGDTSSDKGFSHVMIYLKSEQDLFAATTAVLEQLNLNVLSARISATRGTFSLSNFVVSTYDNRAIGSEPERLEYVFTKLMDELDDPADYPEIIMRRTPRQLKHFMFPTEVTFSNDTVNHRTIMEVVTPDRPGLLARIAQVLLSFDLSLLNAQITTLGERVEDVFFIAQSDGEPIGDGNLCSQLAEKLCAELDESEDV